MAWILAKMRMPPARSSGTGRIVCAMKCIFVWVAIIAMLWPDGLNAEPRDLFSDTWVATDAMGESIARLR